MRQEYLDKIELHKKWVNSEEGGIRAGLSGADLRGADLSWADLRGADLSWADLRGAKVNEKTRWGNPARLLEAKWGQVSDDLCMELMRYDAANHPEPESFNSWAAGGRCPYDDGQWDRCANFVENRSLWSPGPAKHSLDLVQTLLNECCEFVQEGEGLK